MHHGHPVLGDLQVPQEFLSPLTLRGQLELLRLELVMCVAHLGVTLGSTVLMDQRSVQRHPALRLKMTTDLWVVMYVDGQGATVIFIALVDRFLAQRHLILRLTQKTDLVVVMSVEGLAVIAKTTRTSNPINRLDHLLPLRTPSSRETAPGVRHRATGLRPHSSARSPSSRGSCP